MKNRYIPFGYQIQNGDSVINTEQAATVQHIFYAYTEGQSFKEIAEYLTTSGTAYHFSDNSWNKNIVARILANEIYCGAKGYPAIISKEVYSQAASIRSNKTVTYIEPFTHTQTPALASRKRLLMRVLLFGKVSYYTMDTGSRIKLVREHRGLTQQKLGEMLGYGKSSANRIAQYEMGYRSPKANRLKEIAKAMNIREEIFLMPDETPIDLLRILIWYDWEHEGVLQLATSRTANTPPGKTVSPIIYSEQLPLNRLLLDWADQKHSLSVRKITRADYLEWMLQWPPRLP